MGSHLKILLLLFLMALSCRAQVYSYEIPGNSNFEFNPSLLASGKFKMLASATHQGFQAKSIYYDNLRFALYDKSRFVGAGAAITRYSLNDSTNYYCFGIGAGYRIVMFNKVFTRIGVMYKQVITQAPSGIFSYNDFLSDSVSGSRREPASNLNLALSFSSISSKFYLHLGLLNYSPKSGDAGSVFPSYSYVQVGDLAKICGLKRWQAYYLYMLNESKGNSTSGASHYLMLQNQTILFSRHANINLGARTGISEQDKLHLSPMILYDHHDGSRQVNLLVLWDFMYNIRKEKLNYYPAMQIGLVYKH